MQRIERQAKPVLTQQLAAQLLDAEAAGAPKFENERFLFGEHLLPAGGGGGGSSFSPAMPFA